MSHDMILYHISVIHVTVIITQKNVKYFKTITLLELKTVNLIYFHFISIYFLIFGLKIRD